MDTEDQRPIFLKIPVELRIEIYKLVFKKHGPVHFPAALSPYLRRNQNSRGKMMQFGPSAVERGSDEMARETRQHLLTLPPLRPTALLSTCKQINAEATSVLYAVNMIVFLPKMYDFQPRMNQRQLNLTTYVCRNLKRLTLWIRDSTVELVRDPSQWRDRMDYFRTLCPHLNRVTIIFQSDAWRRLRGELQRGELDEEQWNGIWAALQQDPGKLIKIDVGYYSTLQHAFNAMSEMYRYEYR
ncbi:hypothetical protein F4818DRAFT_20199 [Hypoxylon cercidicola]|nr:hypothetical protein F4818DRAFT_20199 [Hypoxylon cercidicola]